MSNHAKSLLALVISTTLILSVNAQQFVFPKNGQTAEQQQKDEYNCHSWAVTQTGVDPTQAQTASAAPATPTAQAPVAQGAQPGSGIRGGISGAAAGAVIAGIGDNDVSNGAAKGAAIGAIASRRQSRKAAAQAQNQQQAAQQEAAQQTAQAQQVSTEQLANYNKAKTVCLDAKGYSVSE